MASPGSEPVSEQPPKGFWNDLRGQGCLVRGAVLLGAAIFLSPILVGLLAFIDETFGGGWLALVMLGILGFAGWWLFTEPGRVSTVAAPAARRAIAWDRAHDPWRYCGQCGSSFGLGVYVCPECNAPWVPTPDTDSIAFLTVVLNDLTTRFMEGSLDRQAFYSLREFYERRLLEVRPAAARPEAEAEVAGQEAAVHAETAAVPAAEPAPVPVAATVAEATPALAPAPVEAVPPPPREPRTPFGELVMAWAAERQADILLYLGAFLISVAALIFLSYQGQAVSPIARVGILTVYTVGFLGLGIMLHHWERAREAGPIFLALGAILVPIDLLAALRIDAFESEGLPKDVLWLVGSSGAAVLYAMLAWRGYGRYYIVPVIPASLVAWGSLAFVLNIPVEWHGAWFELVAAAVYIEASRGRLPLARWIRWGGVALGGGALVYSVGAAFEDVHQWQLSASFAVATVALLGGIYLGRSLFALSAAPLLGAVAAGAAAWAAGDPDPAWYTWYVALAGCGYLVIAHYDRGGPVELWRSAAFGPWLVASVAALGFTANDGPPYALVATLGVIAAGNAAGAGRWRLAWRPGLATLPISVAGAAAAFTHAAFETTPEWLPAWLAAAAAGYLLIAEFDPRARREWQPVALAAGALALTGAFGAVAGAPRGSSEEFVLPVTLGVLTAATTTGVGRWRLDWRAGVAILPAIVPATAASLAWAWFEMPLHWTPVWVALAAVAYLLPAELDAKFRVSWQTVAMSVAMAAVVAMLPATIDGEGRARHEFVQPATLGLLTVGAAVGTWRWRLAWRPGVATVPALVAATAGTLSWAWFEMSPGWAPAFVAAAAVGYLVPALADLQLRESWRIAGLFIGGAAVAHAALVVSAIDRGDPEEFVLPLTLSIALAGAAAGVAAWRLEWRPGVATLPALIAATAATLAWAWLEMPPEWAPCWMAAAAAGYIAPSAFDAGKRGEWRRTALVMGAVAAFWATGPVSNVDRDSSWEFILPVALAILLVGNAAGVGLWRLAWREGIAPLPALAAAAAGSFLWAAIDMPTVWTGAWLAAAAAGYLGPAELDRARRKEWRLTSGAFAAAALTGAHVAASGDFPHPAQLPVTYGIVLAAAVADASRRRDWSLLLPPALAAMFGATALWSADAGAEWWAFPALGIAVALAASEPAWRRGERAFMTGWSYVLALSAIPSLLAVGTFVDEPAHGMAAFGITAILFAAAALRSTGALLRLLERELQFSTGTPESRPTAERASLWYGAAAFAIASGGYFNDLAGMGGSDRAWVFLGFGAMAWLLAAGVALRVPAAPFYSVPPALVACSLAAGLAAPSPAAATVVLAVSAVLPGVAFATTRFPPFWLAAGIYASLAAWSAWAWAGLPDWSLAGAYGVSAALVWLALWGVRRYGRFETMRDSTVQALSWAPWLLAGATALVVLSARSTELAEGERLVRTPEWAMLVSVLAAGSAAVTAEGWRLHNRYVQQAGTLGLLVALLFTIAIGEPSNIQAYAIPIGLYIVGTSLTIQRSDPLFGRHMDQHEGLIVIGALFIVLPPAQQGFEPGGAIYGFELIGIGLLFLFAGLILHARWLVPAGVLTITGVAVRWLTGGFVEVPFWLVLGVVGTLLLAVGTFILLQRERWDTWRGNARSWWLSTTARPADAAGPRPV